MGGCEGTDKAEEAEGWTAEQGHPWVTSWECEPIGNHAQADLRGWPSVIVRELGTTGPGALVASKPLTDSKTKFLLVIYPCRVNYVFKKLFNRIAFRSFVIAQLPSCLRGKQLCCRRNWWGFWP